MDRAAQSLKGLRERDADDAILTSSDPPQSAPAHPPFEGVSLRVMRAVDPKSREATREQRPAGRSVTRPHIYEGLVSRLTLEMGLLLPEGRRRAG
jgi:hypothetical protein